MHKYIKPLSDENSNAGDTIEEGIGMKSHLFYLLEISKYIHMYQRLEQSKTMLSSGLRNYQSKFKASRFLKIKVSVYMIIL